MGWRREKGGGEERGCGVGGLGGTHRETIYGEVDRRDKLIDIICEGALGMTRMWMRW